MYSNSFLYSESLFVIYNTFLYQVRLHYLP
jgi:hypothetical protein